MSDATQVELLERAVNEIDALHAIYGCEGDDESSFVVISASELEIARRIIDENNDSGSIPQLEVEIKVTDGETTKCVHTLRCRLPPGYPEVPAIVAASVDGWSHSQKEALSAELSTKAESMNGFESIMGLVDDLRELAPSLAPKESAKEAAGDGTTNTCRESNEDCSIGRRWIWVHHIKDTARRKAILQEARDLKLGGYLKSGYPGIIVIEGDIPACNEFVTWVKGNKSRPGGFGRNWGHHVRGEIDNEGTDRQLPIDFEELEDLALLGSLCKSLGLEEEFLEYVMQHKGNGS